MRIRDPRTTDRAQAYTLEGFVGAMIVLMAVLFALQSVVITPTTGGSVDRTVQAQLQGETRDALAVAGNGGDLSRLVRYWNSTDGEFHNASDDYENRPGNYSAEDFANPDAVDGSLGQILDERFAESGRNYNVELVYQTEGNGAESIDLLYQGRPSPNAFTASQTVTLYDDQGFTSPGGGRDRLGDGGYPIPDVDAGGDDTELYNVVEVRVVVW